MLRIDRIQNTLQPLPPRRLADAAITERGHLQEFIYNSPEAFFGDIRLQLFLVGKEVYPSEVVDDRIDLLGIAPDGTAVVVELKRGSDKLQLLQALSYAAMISKWRPKDFLDRLDAARQTALESFLETSSFDDLNRSQKVVLVAEAFDWEVLATAEWLSESYNMDIACVRITLAVDDATGAEYLNCVQIYPAPELEEQAVRRRAVSRGTVQPRRTFEQILADCNNPEAVNFVRQQVQAGVPLHPTYNNLYYEADGKRRWIVALKRESAYVWQTGRFDGDEELWRSLISQPQTVRAVFESEPTRCLRFHLYTPQDFENFLATIRREAQFFAWEAPRSAPVVADAPLV